MNAKFVELHLLQSFPPSCINRDGNNSPKDCTFGDVRRARISSQCMKRAIRDATVFSETTGVPNALRSRLWAGQLIDDLGSDREADRDILLTLLEGLIGGVEEADEEGEEIAVQEALVAGDGIVPDSATEGLRSKVILQLPSTVGEVIFPVMRKSREILNNYKTEQERIKALAVKKKPKNAYQKDYGKVVKELVSALKSMPMSPDLALYGRMLANNAGMNIDAASQVAHAISTHRLSQEMDYWTAADDLQKGDSKGAANLGSSEFNASVFYRYACISLPILANNLKDEELVKKTVEAFLRASWDAIPTGKLNGHAHFTNPFAALAVVRRKGMPLNLCNAFVKPVKPSKEAGLDENSAKALLDHLTRAREMAPVDDADYYFAQSLSGNDTQGNIEVKKGYGDVIAAVMEKL